MSVFLSFLLWDCTHKQIWLFHFQSTGFCTQSSNCNNLLFPNHFSKIPSRNSHHSSPFTRKTHKKTQTPKSILMRAKERVDYISSEAFFDFDTGTFLQEDRQSDQFKSLLFETEVWKVISSLRNRELMKRIGSQKNQPIALSQNETILKWSPGWIGLRRVDAEMVSLSHCLKISRTHREIFKSRIKFLKNPIAAKPNQERKWPSTPTWRSWSIWTTSETSTLPNRAHIDFAFVSISWSRKQKKYKRKSLLRFWLIPDPQGRLHSLFLGSCSMLFIWFFYFELLMVHFKLKGNFSHWNPPVAVKIPFKWFHWLLFLHHCFWVY